MPVLIKWIVFSFVFSSMVFYMLRDIFKLLPSSWDAVTLDMEGISVVTHVHNILSGSLAQSTFVSPYFVVLCVVPDGLRWPVCSVIFPDATEADLYRKLCIRLKYG